MLTEMVPLVTFAKAADAAELSAGNKEVGEEGSRVGLEVVAPRVVAAAEGGQVAAVGRFVTL